MADRGTVGGCANQHQQRRFQASPPVATVDKTVLIEVDQGSDRASRADR
jgi:hypothetical protein